MNTQIMPKGSWLYFFSGVTAHLPAAPSHLLAVGAGPSLPTAALADPINRDGNFWVVPRAVSTSKLAPDWLHKSEQPIRSQVGKLTHLMTIATIYKFPFQYDALEYRGGGTRGHWGPRREWLTGLGSVGLRQAVRNIRLSARKTSSGSSLVSRAGVSAHLCQRDTKCMLKVNHLLLIHSR